MRALLTAYIAHRVNVFPVDLHLAFLFITKHIQSKYTLSERSFDEEYTGHQESTLQTGGDFTSCSPTCVKPHNVINVAKCNTYA